jgi:deazaflavin-dependent oxidoreductase (nitroreductase family)
VEPGERAALDGLAGESYLYLGTTGRRTGRPHQIEIWFALHEGTAYLLSGAGDGSDWVRNLRADPACSVRIGGREFRCEARILEQGTDEDERARRMVYEKYQPGYSGDLAEWRQSSRVVALDLA